MKPPDLEIQLLGEIRVVSQGIEVGLPASRKARALLAFLVATGRPHRRERLCELFWGLPDDPKASLRWALSKLRRVVDTADRPRILADRERVAFDVETVRVDLREIHERLGRNGVLPVDVLEQMARQLAEIPYDGLDGAGDSGFETWLMTERADARASRVSVLRQLARHPDVTPIAREKWLRVMRDADPLGAEAADDANPGGDVRPAPLPTPAPPLGTARASAIGLEEEAAPGFALSGADAAELAGSRSAAAVEARSRSARALRAQQIGFCQVPDGTKIAYATLGTGSPILKAANWLNHLELDWNSPIWGSSFAELARQRMLVRYDERGCGLSDWDVDDLSFEAFVEDLEAVADKLGLERFPLLGISQGCAVSIEYAVRHPERVAGLILISGYAAGWRLLCSPEEQARREAVLALTKVGWGTDNPAYRHIFSKTFMPDASPADLDWFDEFQRQTTSPDNAARFQDAFGHIDVRHRLAKVQAPTIVIHAKHDQRIPFDLGRAVASGIPNARFVPLESRNHILVGHEPAWKVCFDTINEFLSEHGI